MRLLEQNINNLILFKADFDNFEKKDLQLLRQIKLVELKLKTPEDKKISTKLIKPSEPTVIENSQKWIDVIKCLTPRRTKEERDIIHRFGLGAERMMWVMHIISHDRAKQIFENHIGRQHDEGSFIKLSIYYLDTFEIKFSNIYGPGSIADTLFLFVVNNPALIGSTYKFFVADEHGSIVDKKAVDKIISINKEQKNEIPESIAKLKILFERQSLESNIPNSLRARTSKNKI